MNVYGLILLAVVAAIAINLWWIRKFIKLDKLDKIEDTLNKILAILERDK